jgi:peptidoglycan-N-acetylglucosamine deacetylase
MEDTKKQIFLTDSPTRWQRFKWSFRIVLFIVLLMLLVVAMAASRFLFIPSLPLLRNNNNTYNAILDKGKQSVNNEISKSYKSFSKYIGTQAKSLQTIKYVSAADSLHHYSLPVRAAFYDAKDEQSYFSLKNNISKLNMLLPEWMYIDSVADTVYVNSDVRGQEIIRGSGVPVVAMLSNFVGDDFNGTVLHRMLNDPKKRAKVISQVIRILQDNKFAGVNIDFEELREPNDEVLVTFMKELYEGLHPLSLLVTQDVSPFNSDYDYKNLARYNDYIFLMAYDQHHADGLPGPISHQDWIEKAVDEARKQIPDKKMILALAGYGYDWQKNTKGSDVTYFEALSIAKESESKVVFDTDSYNLYYNYTDDDDKEHTVWFTDAASNFNTMRYATDLGSAGVALWRLGSEDSRLWTFYNRDLGDDAIKTFKFDTLNKIGQSNDVDYEGEGEILDVISTPHSGVINAVIDTANKLVANEVYDSLPSIFVIKKFGQQSKKVVLSFDDGPDETYTPQIVDILSREHVPAVFFMIGANIENNIPLVKRIYREGFEIGNHTFTHPNMAEVGRRRALLELNATRLLLESITGHSTVLFRAPYNADSEPETMQELEPVALSKENNYLTVGESIDPNDWEKGISPDTIFARVVQQEAKGNIILLHDAGGNREATVKILPKIIHYFKDKGYTFTTVADLIGKKRDQLMPPVPKTEGYYWIQGTYFIAEFANWASRTLFFLFVLCILLSLGKIVFLGILAFREHRRDAKKNIGQLEGFPPISVIVPAYNEEVNAVRTLNNLLEFDYPNFKILFVDDGSKDGTYVKVKEAMAGNPKVQVFTKPNGGKASALNFGIEQADSEYVLCIDADTHLSPYALRLMVQHMTDESIGAVAGNVKVGNEINLLTRWQSIEYITSQNFDRNAFAAINAITVVPGAIGLFRKKAIAIAGGFTSDTFAEDCDLTMRLLRAGFSIKNENRAIAYTEAPETMGQFLKQRFRWSFGIMQSFWKNRDALFNAQYGSLGWVALPNILVFQILIPLISPLADVLMLIGILSGNGIQIAVYYGLFMLVDLSVGVVAFLFEKESLWKLVWLIPQRLIYRWLMLFVLYKSIRRAFQGQLQSWGVLKRTGNIKENPRAANFKM